MSCVGVWVCGVLCSEVRVAQAGSAIAKWRKTGLQKGRDRTRT